MPNSFDEFDSGPATGARNSFDEFDGGGNAFDEFDANTPDAIAGTANEFKRGLLAGQQQILAAELASAPKAPTMRQLRNGYVTAMSDPRYGLALNAAGDDPQRLKRVEDTLGPTAQVDKVTTAIRANRQFIAEDIAKLESEAQAIPASEAMTAWGQADNSNWYKVLAKHPFQITAGIMAQSLPAMAPAMAMNTIAPGGRVGKALATGAGSFGTEAANAYLDSARQTGYDFTDPVKVQEFFDNPEAQATARAFAVKRGVPIAIFDSLTAGIAGKFLGPARKQGAKKVLIVTAKEIGVQMTGGAAGEAAAQVVSGQKLSLKDIVAEALGELGSAPQEVISNLREGRANRAAPAVPPAAPDRPMDDELPPAPPAAGPRIIVGRDDQGRPVEAEKLSASPSQSDVARAAEAEAGPAGTKNVPAAAEPTAAAPEQSAAVPPSPVPEDPRTITAQMEMLRSGKRSAVLITEGEALPEVPANFKTVELPGYGTMIYNPRVHREERIIALAKEDKLGRVLGYGVDRKPAAADAVGVVTVRSPEGVEKQAVVTSQEDLPKVVVAAEQVSDKEDTVQLEPAEQVIADRQSAIGNRQSKSPVTPRHLAEARQALEVERPPSVHDDISGEVTAGPVRFPEADFRDMLDTVRDELAQAQYQKPYKKLRKDQRAKVDGAHRMSVSAGTPADQVLNAIAAANPKYEGWSVDDLAEALGRPVAQTEDTKQVQQLASEIAQAETERSAAAEEVTDFDQAAAAAQADQIETLLNRAINATNLNRAQTLEGITGAPVWLTKSALNGLLRIIRATYRGTKSLAQAIQAGIEWLRAQNLPNFSETEIKAWLAQHVTVTPHDDDINMREFGDQLAADQLLPPDPARMVANLLYDRRTNESDAAFAARVMQAVGGPAAAVEVFTDAANGLPGSVRMFLGQLIIKAFGVAGQHDQAARFYDETFAGYVTDTAQSLQALGAFLALTPEGKLIWARRKIERAARDLVAPVQPQLDAAKQELDAANAAGIEQTTASADVQEAARAAVDAALEKQATTPGTELAEAIRKEVLDALVAAGLITAREAEIFRLHLEGTADNSTLAQKLERAGIPMHDKRADAINQLYKARTKTEREKIKSWARRARAQLNPKAPRQQRQPTQEDWIRKARSIPSREIQDAAVKLRRALESTQPRRSPALQEFYQRLTTRLKALLPEQGQAPSQALTDEQLLREVFTNPEKYAEVWAQLGMEIRAKYGVEGMADLTTTLGNLSPAALVQQTMESHLDRIIRTQMQNLRVQFGQLIRQHYTQQAATAGTLTENIVSSIGLAEADAAALALVVQRRFAQLVTKTKQTALAKLLQPVKPIAKPALIEKLVTLSNLGALTQEQFWNAVRSMLDLPMWSNELAGRIRAQVDIIERVPADQIERKQKAQIDLLNMVERAKGVDGLDLALAFYITNVLTGVTTHLKNIGSTFLNASAAIGSEAARAVATGRLDDLPLLLEAIGQGVKRGQLAAGDVLRTGVVTGSRLTKVEAGRALELTQFGTKGGVPVRGTISKAILENRLAGILNLWKYNFRIMAAEDLLFFKPAEEAKAALLAKRVARSEGLRGAAATDRARQLMGYGLKAVATARAQASQEGLQGSSAARRAAELLNNNRPLELREDARQFALRTTFNNDPYGALGFIAHLLNQAKAAPNRKVRFAANLITPFTNIIANVVNESLNYTPVGAARARWSGNELLGYQKAKLTVQQQADLKAELYSKALVGTVLLTSIALKAAADLDDEDPAFAIYGAGPAAGTDRQGLEAKGWTAHTIKLGDRYYNYGNTPLALPFAWLGGISDRIRDARLFGNRSAQRTAESLPLMAASSAVGMGKVITEQSFMVGLMDLASMMSQPSPEAGGRQMLKQAVRTASSFVVPNAVRQVDKFFDPTQYEQRTAEGILVNAIPFVRGAHGQPALNALGLPITRPLSTQFTSSQADAPALVKFLAETGNWPTMPNRNEIYAGTGRTMTDTEYYQYVKESGASAYRELEQIRLHDDLEKEAPEDQAKIISKVISAARAEWRDDHGW
jgi:hypothetical protein